MSVLELVSSEASCQEYQYRVMSCHVTQSLDPPEQGALWQSPHGSGSFKTSHSGDNIVSLVGQGEDTASLLTFIAV